MTRNRNATGIHGRGRSASGESVAVATLLFIALAGGEGCVGKSAKHGGAPPPVSTPGAPTNSQVIFDMPGGDANVVVDVNQRYQVLEGFGASVAWYQDRITGNAPEGIYDLLFPELGLDILRFRNRFQRSEANDKDLSQEVEILRRATHALGHPPRLMFSSWSPPGRMKASGQERCHGNENCTLSKRNGRFAYDEFAEYWRASLEHYASLGLRFEFVSIQNEPSFLPTDWEGCKFEPAETEQYPGYDQALAKVSEHLAQLSYTPKLLGPEVLGVHWNRPQNFLGAMDESLVFGIAHHLYERGNDDIWDWRQPGPDSFVEPMRAVKRLTNKPIFQTEFQTDDDRSMDGGFETAWLIHNSLVEEDVVAWLYWNLVWDSGGGLASISGGRTRIRDQYYSLKHYARYTDPGDIRVEATSDAARVRASAFVSPDAARVTLILLNVSGQAMRVKASAPGYPATPRDAYLTTYRPGTSAPWKPLATTATGFNLPARSAATLVFGG